MERLVVVTGLAGSGKSLAANCLEDLGYFCVDNLPTSLIPAFCRLLQGGRNPLSQAALVVDAREPGFSENFPRALRDMRQSSLSVQLLFFDCSDDVLKRRFSESRRPHPTAGPDDTLEQAITEERTSLAPIRDMADRIIDTTRYSAHELRSFLKSAYGSSEGADQPRVNVLSFGFKYGVPAEADLVFDVRFLPNPYFVDGLRKLDGRDAEVVEFLDGQDVTGRFMERLQSFLDFLVPHYTAEGKAYLTIAIGCTGGKHRSVALSEKLVRHFEAAGLPVSGNHRDLGKE